MIRIFLAASLAILAGCSSKPPLPGTMLTETRFGAVEISEQAGPMPWVVFVSGISGTNQVWDTVYADIGETNAVFADHRPGYGRTPDTDRPRDGETIVAELRALLRAREIALPAVFVGHSAGGLHMQLYARRYPEEVAGLVLVDPVHPSQFTGEGTMENRAPVLSNFKGLLRTFAPHIAGELKGITEAGEQVLAAPPMRPDIPVIILTATKAPEGELAAFDTAKRADFARLYPSADVRPIDAGHVIQTEKPEVVIRAIREVLAEAR